MFPSAYIIRGVQVDIWGVYISKPCRWHSFSVFLILKINQTIYKAYKLSGNFDILTSGG